MRRNLPTQLQVSHRQCVGQLATRLLVSNTNGRSLATRVLHCSFYVFSVSPYNTWLLPSRHRVADDLQRLSLQHIFQILAAQAVGGWGGTVYCLLQRGPIIAGHFSPSTPPLLSCLSSLPPPTSCSLLPKKPRMADCSLRVGNWNCQGLDGKREVRKVLVKSIDMPQEREVRM